jgi:hypothetical protein
VGLQEEGGVTVKDPQGKGSETVEDPQEEGRLERAPRTFCPQNTPRTGFLERAPGTF